MQIEKELMSGNNDLNVSVESKSFIPPPHRLNNIKLTNERHICSCCFGTAGDVEEYQMKTHTLHPKSFSKSRRASDLEEFYHFIKEEQLK